MIKGINVILLIMVGMVIGIAATLGVWYLKHRSTDVWTAQVDLVSDNGVLIPHGTQMIFDTWMPEGFARLKLYVNVEGTTLDTFEQTKAPKFNLIIPYSVTEAPPPGN